MAGHSASDRLSLGGVQGNPGDQGRPPVAISRERISELAREPGCIQGKKSHPSVGSCWAAMKGLHGFAAVAEIAATKAYGRR